MRFHSARTATDLTGPRHSGSDRPRTALRSPLARLGAVLCLLAVLAAALPSSAADLEDEIAELEADRAEVQRQQEEQAAQIDAATAETEQLTQALEVWNRKVSETEASLEEAQANLADAEAQYEKANGEVVLAEARLADLEEKVAERAVSAFVGRATDAVPTVNSREPKEATRMRTMVGEATDRDFDVAEELRATREDLAFKRAQAQAAQEKADLHRAEIEADLVEVEDARDTQAQLTAEAEERLERELYEQAVLEERDAELARQQDAKTKELAAQLAAAQRRAAAEAAARQRSSTAVTNVTYPSNDQIVKVGGFYVHVDIAQNLSNLLSAAAADGHNLGGWGYRDHQAQIRLRKAHCGSSDWAIWNMPSSQCSPPTARPGRSMHEQGKAIDFTYNGGSISSRSNAGYRWLSANAAKYGFYNLPSEPWHWSVNGN